MESGEELRPPAPADTNDAGGSAEEQAAVKIQAVERGRAMRERKRAELKAKAKERRRQLHEQLHEQDAKLHQTLLKQEHDADAEQHAQELQQASMRKQQLLNARLTEKRRQLEEETYCLGLCTRQTELGRANATKRQATAVRQAADAEAQQRQERREKKLLTISAKWDAEATATSRLGSGVSAAKLPAGAGSNEVDREQLKREPILKLSHHLKKNVRNGVTPQRRKVAWLKLTAEAEDRERAAEWIEVYPFAVVGDGLSCQVFESIMYTSDTGVNTSTIKFEDVEAFQADQPEELRLESSADEGKLKQNIGETAVKLRTDLIDFLTTGDDTTGKRQIHSKNLVLFAVYFACLCAMTVLVMLVPGAGTLGLAWPVVIGVGAVGYIGTKFNLIWLLMWIYTTLLLLVPGSIMANAESTSYWPNAAGI
jgi:hypothetical protein